MSADDAPDLLIIPPSLAERLPDPSPELLDWLRALHARRCVLTSVCAGIFLLAPTGLLDGKGATTHWSFADVCRKKFPAIEFHIERMLVDEGDIVTAGGITAWTDLVLAMVGRFFGGATAVALGKYFLLDTSARVQSCFSCFAPPLTHGDAVVLEIQHEMERNYATPISLTKLAAGFNLSVRTLQRRFSAATGDPPQHYLRKLRIAKAQERLERSRQIVEEIAAEVGYEDLASFRKQFRRECGISPADYRKRLSFPDGSRRID